MHTIDVKITGATVRAWPRNFRPSTDRVVESYMWDSFSPIDNMERAVYILRRSMLLEYTTMIVEREVGEDSAVFELVSNRLGSLVD